MEMILELIDSEFDWKVIDLKFIDDTILKHGSQNLGAAGEFAKAFVYITGTVASDTNPDHDCDSNGENDCRDWSLRIPGCRDDGDQCEHRHNLGNYLPEHDDGESLHPTV